MSLAVFLLAGLLGQAEGLPKDPAVPPAGRPKPETIQAFERYVRLTESRLEAASRGEDDFLWATTTARRARLRGGDVLCEPRNRKGDLKVPHGLIHDWVGAVFIPNATVDDVLDLLRDYDRHRATYRPEVLASRTLARNGDDYTVYMRLMKRMAITVVLDTEHAVRYEPLGERCWQSRSRTTRIVEIDRPGGPRERELPEGKDHGFLWRLNTYWRFHPKDDGVYVECQAVSLSRAAPAALAWLINPIVRRLPPETLAKTLKSTRAALVKRDHGAGPPLATRK